MGEEADKTEEPTPHKLNEARKKGQIVKSKDATGAVLLFVAFYAFKATAPRMWGNLETLGFYSFEQISKPFNVAALGQILDEAMWLFFLTVGPVFAANFLAALILEAMQTQFLITFEPLQPKFDKLNPIEGFKKYFKLKQYVEALKSALKLFIIWFLIYGALKNKIGVILIADRFTTWEVMKLTATIIMDVINRLGIFYIVIAFYDYFYQRYEYMKSMRMSKKEIKDEYKRLEGDPLVKQRQRDAARALSSGRQMGSVPSSDVVVTNPTHIALALKYKAGEMKAPLVVAKGERLLAQEIKKIAEEHFIPIVENPPLARALFAITDAGKEVPPQYYQAVAEILAFVYNLKKKRKNLA